MFRNWISLHLTLFPYLFDFLNNNNNRKSSSNPRRISKSFAEKLVGRRPMGMSNVRSVGSELRNSSMISKRHRKDICHWRVRFGGRLSSKICWSIRCGTMTIGWRNPKRCIYRMPPTHQSTPKASKTIVISLPLLPHYTQVELFGFHSGVTLQSGAI